MWWQEGTGARAASLEDVVAAAAAAVPSSSSYPRLPGGWCVSANSADLGGGLLFVHGARGVVTATPPPEVIAHPSLVGHGRLREGAECSGTPHNLVLHHLHQQQQEEEGEEEGEGGGGEGQQPQDRGQRQAAPPPAPTPAAPPPPPPWVRKQAGGRAIWMESATGRVEAFEPPIGADLGGGWFFSGEPGGEFANSATGERKSFWPVSS